LKNKLIYILTGKVKSSNIMINVEDIISSYKNLEQTSWISLIKFLPSIRLADYTVQHPLFKNSRYIGAIAAFRISELIKFQDIKSPSFSRLC